VFYPVLHSALRKGLLLVAASVSTGLVAANGLSLVTGTGPTPAGRLTLLPILAYAQSGINTGVFRRHAMLTIGSQQLIAYFGEDGRLVLVQRSQQGSNALRTLECSPPMPAGMLGDGHQGVNLGHSSDGFVHVIWGCHDTPNPSYLKLQWPELTPCTDAPPPWTGTASRLSYPQFYGPADQLLLSFRRDSNPADHNPYDHCLLRYDVQAGQWKPLQVPLVKFPPAPQLAYLNNLGQAGDTMAAAYTIRRYDLMDTNDVNMRVMNESFRVIFSRDAGKHWVGINGQPLRSPVASLGVEPAFPIAPDQNLINQGGGWLGRDHRYHIVYFKNDEAGIPQIYLSIFDLATGRHDTQALTRRSQAFNLLGRGTQVWPISRPVIFELGTTWVVAFREGDRLMTVLRSAGASYWRVAELYAGELGNYEPILDYTAVEGGKLTFYLQTARQGTDDQAHANTASAQASLLDLTEAELLALPAKDLATLP